MDTSGLVNADLESDSAELDNPHGFAVGISNFTNPSRVVFSGRSTRRRRWTPFATVLAFVVGILVLCILTIVLNVMTLQRHRDHAAKQLAAPEPPLTPKDYGDSTVAVMARRNSELRRYKKARPVLSTVTPDMYPDPSEWKNGSILLFNCTMSRRPVEQMFQDVLQLAVDTPYSHAGIFVRDPITGMPLVVHLDENDVLVEPLSVSINRYKRHVAIMPLLISEQLESEDVSLEPDAHALYKSIGNKVMYSGIFSYIPIFFNTFEWKEQQRCSSESDRLIADSTAGVTGLSEIDVTKECWQLRRLRWLQRHPMRGPGSHFLVNCSQVCILALACAGVIDPASVSQLAMDSTHPGTLEQVATNFKLRPGFSFLPPRFLDFSGQYLRRIQRHSYSLDELEQVKRIHRLKNK